MPTLFLALALGAAPLGCAHADSVEGRHIAEMNDTIGKVQVEQDRSNHAFMDEPAVEATTKAAASAKAPPRAAQRTIQLGEEDADHSGDDPNDPAARPEIRLQGNPGASYREPSRRTGRGARDHGAEPLESLRTEGPRSPALDPDAKRAYENALAQVNSRQYDKALESWNAFLVRWPDHPYAENALYWRGESFFAKGEYLRAAEQFEAVVSRYGGGKKGPDALLKIGMCHLKLGATERANEYFERLRRDFAHSDAAKKIPATESTRGGSGPKETR